MAVLKVDTKGRILITTILGKRYKAVSAEVVDGKLVLSPMDAVPIETEEP